MIGSPVSLALLAVSAAWIGSEIGLAVLRRSGAGASRRDDGSLAILNGVVYGSVALGLFLAGRGIGRFPTSAAVAWAGLAAIVLGLALRWWSILTLRRFFTVDVAIHADHHLVEAGPYRVLRHPAYAGSLLSFAGLAACTSSWVAAPVVFLPIAAAFVHRIRVEERALRAAFPGEYAAYAARTARLVPGAW
jgi:protein-S-isoprenylcysteine O-methyltransferase